MLRLWLLLGLSACIEDHLVPCGDELCPADYSCDAERAICVMPNGLSIAKAFHIDDALCGQSTGLTVTVRNFSSTAIAYDSILTDIGVVASPSSGAFPPGDTDILLSAVVPLEAIPGPSLDGKLLISLPDGVARRDLKVTPTGAVLGVSTHSLSFGENAVASPVSSDVTYSNTGNLAVDLGATIRGGAPQFSIVSNPDLHLEPGDSRTYTVSFASNTELSYTSNLDVTPDATLCQKPLDPVAMDGAVTLSAILLNHLGYDFGDVACNAPPTISPLTITSTNASMQDVTLTLKGNDADLFSIDTPALVLPGMGQAMVNITRKPLGYPPPLGHRDAELDITANLGGLVTQKSVTLVETVRAPIVQMQELCIDFPNGLIAPHSTGFATFTLVNSGNTTAAVAIQATAMNGSVSPSNVQIAGLASLGFTYAIVNTTNGYYDVEGLPLGSVTILNGCSGAIGLLACGNPQ